MVGIKGRARIDQEATCINEITRRKIESEGALLLDRPPTGKTHAARRCLSRASSGSWSIQRDVGLRVDTGLLAYDDAMYLRSVGVSWYWMREIDES